MPNYHKITTRYFKKQQDYNKKMIKNRLNGIGKAKKNITKARKRVDLFVFS